MKTNMIFTCAMLCTSLGILSMEPEKAIGKLSSPAVKRRKQTAPNINSSPSPSNSYRGYYWYISRNELIPEEVIKKLDKQDTEKAHKHNRCVHSNIDGCSYINSQPKKTVPKDEQKKLVITGVPE